MRIEIPKCLRCCLCLPLRYGILVFGYLNLIFSILVVIIQALLDSRSPPSSETLILYRGIEVITYVWLPYFLYAMEIVFNIVLIIGAHIKSTPLIRTYYYYGMMTTIAVFVTFIVIRFDDRREDWYYRSFEICQAIASFVLQVYLLLVIRSELNKVRYQEGQLKSVNHMTEVSVDPEAACGRHDM